MAKNMAFFTHRIFNFISSSTLVRGRQRSVLPYLYSNSRFISSRYKMPAEEKNAESNAVLFTSESVGEGHPGKE